QLADVNGDGRADIIGFGHYTVAVALGQSDGTFGRGFTATDEFTVVKGGWTSNDRFPVQVADVNGDGRADIIGFGHHTVAVALGQSDGTFGTATTVHQGFTIQNGFSSFDNNPREVADINGDGQADLVGFGDAQVNVSLSKDVDDQLIGGLGNDRLVGGAGNDILVGGVDADTFVFEVNAATEGINHIKDFNASEGDMLQISQSAFGIMGVNEITFNAITGELFVGGEYQDTLAIFTNQVGFDVNTHIMLV
ncbi:FG-GAP-like repeat-containing protein, partial [Acaryochloris sp. IP29b_bin.148]|uniref:FG-GAP-like repeat-containing protein n=1 Tax=Acaryochloris sp. IP29b_bin.148 TaxID=2969218 RepID=UPI0026214857